MLRSDDQETWQLLSAGHGHRIGLSLGLAHGVWPTSRRLGDDLPWADARTLAEVLERVKHDYVNPVDDHQLLQAAIRGMVSSLDPYSAYLDGDEYDEVKISSSGQYSGVGIEVSMEDEQVVVVSPFDGSPAAAGGDPPAATSSRPSTGPREYHHPGRHHRAHARQGGDLRSRSASCATATPNRCYSP